VSLHSYNFVQQFLDDQLKDTGLGERGQVLVFQGQPTRFLLGEVIIYILPLSRRINELEDHISEAITSVNVNILC
jgi:hypothetical protein